MQKHDLYLSLHINLCVEIKFAGLTNSQNVQNSEMCHLFPSYFIENDSLKHDFSVFLQTV